MARPFMPIDVSKSIVRRGTPNGYSDGDPKRHRVIESDRADGFNFQKYDSKRVARGGANASNELNRRHCGAVCQPSNLRIKFTPK